MKSGTMCPLLLLLAWLCSRECALLPRSVFRFIFRPSCHLVHDERRCLPGLIDGSLGRLSGSTGCGPDPVRLNPSEGGGLLMGTDGILAIRLRFYDQMLVYGKSHGRSAA